MNVILSFSILDHFGMLSHRSLCFSWVWWEMSLCWTNILSKLVTLHSHIYFLKKLWNFFGTKSGSYSGQKIISFSLGVFFDWEISIYFCPLFVHFRTLEDTLTYSAMNVYLSDCRQTNSEWLRSRRTDITIILCFLLFSCCFDFLDFLWLLLFCFLFFFLFFYLFLFVLFSTFLHCCSGPRDSATIAPVARQPLGKLLLIIIIIIVIIIIIIIIGNRCTSSSQPLGKLPLRCTPYHPHHPHHNDSKVQRTSAHSSCLRAWSKQLTPPWKK